MYKIVGYYICERIPIPGWLHRSGMMLSVSGCFGGIHPRLDTWKEMMPAGPGTDSLLPGVPDKNELLGFDILGWDICSFHSFLCNRLHEMLPGVKFNHYGLLEHTFEETVAFSNKIQGYGEPVLWVPCRIGKCI